MCMLSDRWIDWLILKVCQAVMGYSIPRGLNFLRICFLKVIFTHDHIDGTECSLRAYEYMSVENFAYEFVSVSSALSCTSCSSYLDGLFDGRQVAGQLLFCGFVASRICSKQHSVSLCSSHRAFTPSASINSRWCSDAIIQHSYRFLKIH